LCFDDDCRLYEPISWNHDFYLNNKEQ